MRAQSLASLVLQRASRVAIALAFLAGSAAGARADTWRATYSISLLGLPIGTGAIVGELTRTAYRIEANGKLDGLASLVTNSKGAATGSGAIVAGHVSPATYAVTAADAHMTRTMRMSLAGGAATGVDISPPFEERPDRVPLRDQDKKGIVDPLGAFIFPVAGADPLVGPAACNRTIPIFDGVTRFDVRLAYVGQRRVSATGYSGPVAVCALRYIPIAGHRPNRPGTKFMAENKNMEVWLAPIESARVLLPYRISVKTMIGTAVIEASEFTVEAAKQP
jgi:hypothetical protein